MKNIILIGMWCLWPVFGFSVDQAELRTRYDLLFGSASEAPCFDAFAQASHAYEVLQQTGKLSKPILAIIDFTLPSTEVRLWIVDMDSERVVSSSLVAHGKNSGGNYARDFSNTPQSYKSSVGFFVAQNTYHGKHGLSLRLEGLEPQINDNARERAIVMHGAPYVSDAFIKKVGRLGRSHGCPAVPEEVHKEIIGLLEGGAGLYIWYPDKGYLHRSKLINHGLVSS